MPQNKPTRSAPKKRVSKQDWLDAALDLLCKGGIEAVRVERLAENLGVAKAGFYYHFRDRGELRTVLLEHWLALDQAPFTELEKHPNASPADWLAIVSESVDRHNLSRYDFAIRQWAQQDVKVRRVWRAEMSKRINMIRETIATLGYEGDDLEMRTRLFTAYQVVERDLFTELTAAERARLRKLRLKLLLDP